MNGCHALSVALGAILGGASTPPRKARKVHTYKGFTITPAPNKRWGITDANGNACPRYILNGRPAGETFQNINRARAFIRAGAKPKIVNQQPHQ